MLHCTVFLNITNNKSVAFIVDIDIVFEVWREQERVGTFACQDTREPLDPPPDLPFDLLDTIHFALILAQVNQAN